jgi:hypothetical protein
VVAYSAGDWLAKRSPEDRSAENKSDALPVRPEKVLQVQELTAETPRPCRLRRENPDLFMPSGDLPQLL